MEDNSKLWKKILEEIETEVSKANYLTLFRRTSLISFEDGVATIAVPSAMIIDLLQKRFYDVIKKTVDKHTGLATKIIFIPKTVETTPSAKGDSGPLFVQEEKPTTTIGHLPRVRKDFTFENFAVSSSNQLAFVSATTVSKRVGESYNPLFIYGPVGVGKTHLMQAIANEVYLQNPNKKISYITSEEFTNEVVEAIRSNDTARMKKRFRNIDLLIIDDIQFVAGKERVQEELFHTFNTLVDKGAQIVLSSDRHPSEIKNIEGLGQKAYQLAKSSGSEYLGSRHFFVAILTELPGIDNVLLKLDLKIDDFKEALFYLEKKKKFKVTLVKIHISNLK